jgi:hypothetical protein
VIRSAPVRGVVQKVALAGHPVRRQFHSGAAEMFGRRLPRRRRTAADESVAPDAVHEFGCRESFPGPVRDFPSASPDADSKKRQVAHQARLPPDARRKADFQSLVRVRPVAVAARRLVVEEGAVAVGRKAPCSALSEQARQACSGSSPLDELVSVLTPLEQALPDAAVQQPVRSPLVWPRRVFRPQVQPPV